MASKLVRIIAALLVIFTMSTTPAFGQELGTTPGWNSAADEPYIPSSTFCAPKLNIDNQTTTVGQELGASAWNSSCNFMPKLQEPADTEANTPAAENAPAFIVGTSYYGEWKTEGLDNNGKPYAPLYSRLTMDLVQDNKAIVLYEFGLEADKLSKPQPIAATIEGKSLSFGELGLNRARFDWVLSEDGQTLSCVRQIILKNKEGNEYTLTSTVEMKKEVKDAG